MKILIAGFGSIGRRHFRNLLALGERDIVFLRSKRSTLPDDEIAAFPVETEISAALAHQPEAVIIANPTALHLDVAIPAAEQGCHLFIEKPISHSLERIDDLQAALARGGGKAFTAFQFRFHPGLARIREALTPALSQGERGLALTPDSLAPDSMPPNPIGRPLSVRVHWGEYLPDWHPWEDYRQGYSARADLGGGVVLTLSHPLDYLRWVFGEVQSLWAFTSANSDLELDVEDTAEIGLRFANGVIGSVHLDYVQRPPVHRLEIVGTQGTIRWDNADGVVRVYGPHPGPLPGGEGAGPHPGPLPGGEGAGPHPRLLSQGARGEFGWRDYPLPEGFERNDLFLAEMDHFLRVMRGEDEPICTLEDGIWSQRLVQGVYDSAREGRLITWELHSPSGSDGDFLP